MVRRSIRVTAVAIFASGVANAPANAQPTKIGSEFQVNVSPSSGTSPRVAVDGDGDFLVVYEAGSPCGDVCGRWFDDDGTPGTEFNVSQGTFSSGPFNHDEQLAVDANDAGRFVVAWSGVDDYLPYPSCASPCVLARGFDETGTPLGDVFRAGLDTEDDQGSPEVAIADSGQFVIAWVKGYFEDIFGQRFDATGTPLGARFRANAYEDDYQGLYGYVSASGNADGEFVVVWTGYESDDGEGGNYGRGFKASGTGDAKDFVISPNETDRYYFSPEVAMNPSGTFAVAWEQSNYYVIHARTFDDKRKPASESIVVSGDESGLSTGPAGGGRHPAIDSDAGGNFVVAWMGLDADGWGVFGRAFDALGNPRGDAFQVNTTTTGDQGYNTGIDVALDDAERFVVVWPDEAGGVFGQRFELPAVSEVLVPTQRLQITGHVPSSPQVNRLSWKVKAANLAVGERGGDNDPRCNGDPAGTAKATLRVSSADSGEDTGLLGLPCENWQATGPDGTLAKQGYKYKDSKLDDGLCKKLVLRHGRTLKATCLGKVGGPDFPFDLTEGVGQGTVRIVLDIGGREYCSATGGDDGKDGSDGRLFRGKNAPAPTSCS